MTQDVKAHRRTMPRDYRTPIVAQMAIGPQTLHPAAKSATLRAAERGLAMTLIQRRAGGNLAGLFPPQRRDDLLHALSDARARVAGMASHRQPVFCFRLFGPVCLLDGVLGRVTGFGCLDAGIFIGGCRSFDDIEFPACCFASLPHVVIGGFAVWAGLVLSSRDRLVAA
jgi:hypothetical protein